MTVSADAWLVPHLSFLSRKQSKLCFREESRPLINRYAQVLFCAGLCWSRSFVALLLRMTVSAEGRFAPLLSFLSRKQALFSGRISSFHWQVYVNLVLRQSVLAKILRHCVPQNDSG